MVADAGPLSRAWYRAAIERFHTIPPAEILGSLLRASGNVRATERDAWSAEIQTLQPLLIGLRGTLLLEFTVPRMGRRIDVVLLIGPVVFVIEFKLGATTFDRSAIEQVWDYALDLKNFHAGSHDVPIVPVLVATEAQAAPQSFPPSDPDGVYRPLTIAPTQVRHVIDTMLARCDGPNVDVQSWLGSPYRPTPSIIEAARALYAKHSVETIARSDAGAENLHATSQHLEELIGNAKKRREKIICFVTGVPGAGKTLVGLNVATRKREDVATPAVYLSGNGPLVEVLREALTRDEVARRRAVGERARKGTVRESVKAFVQNVHHFRDEGLRDVNAPAEHVAIFDEAQRAWTRQMTTSFMRRKKNIAEFDCSEAEFLISCMDRHSDWSVVVCLVGGGQEINTGEAGIESWMDAVHGRFSEWRMHISSRLTDSEYAAGCALERVRGMPNVVLDDCLHLAVSMRSFRSEKVSTFVKALLDRERQTARTLLDELGDRYPIAMTRDIGAAKEWLRGKGRGSERYGMVASSKALRLKPHAVDVRVAIDPVLWFLNEKEDTRSSYYLEDAATEFQVQGLELDWTCITWDADLRFSEEGWGYHDFRGSRWTNINKDDARRYLLNAYRVLLTRARQGMVIFVPPGDRRDSTREPQYYDRTASYLRDIGIPLLA
jgi:hypothetical protein